jgi:hypothetical protein
MRKLKSRQLKKKTINHISTRRISFSVSSANSNVESDLQETEALPEIAVGLVPKFDNDFGKRTEYFRKKGANGKIVMGDVLKKSGKQGDALSA